LVEAWGEGLGAFNGEAIKLALDTCLLAYVDFPPTLPQFIRLCKDARDRQNLSVPRLSEKRSRADIPPEVMATIRKLTKRAA
jgi:hypothetical protein